MSCNHGRRFHDSSLLSLCHGGVEGDDVEVFPFDDDVGAALVGTRLHPAGMRDGCEPDPLEPPSEYEPKTLKAPRVPVQIAHASSAGASISRARRRTLRAHWTRL
eukprot:9878977-Karenia_brevis.AAC.1